MAQTCLTKGLCDILTALRKYTVAGILTIIPISLTYFIVRFLVDLLIQAGAPAIVGAAALTRPYSPALAAWLEHPWFQSLLAVLLVVAGLTGLGWFSSQVLGRRVMEAYDRLMGQIPLVRQIYGAAKQLLNSLETKPEGVHRVVLVEFPSPGMKMVGFVTRTFTDPDSGRRLATVFLPTTPNPTTGYLEIIPVERLVSTEWSVDEAMNFIVSGGAVSPPKMNYDKSAFQPPDVPRSAELEYMGDCDER